MPAQPLSPAVSRRFPGVAAGLIVGLLAAVLACAGAQADPLQTPPLRVALDKAEVISLSASASVVLIANPQIADVVVEHNRLVFVVGKRPGETRLYVYSDAGRPLLEREVVVVPQDERAVTIVRDTQPTTYSCDPRCIAVSSSPGTATLAPAAAPVAVAK